MDETYDRPNPVDPHLASPATPNETRPEPSEADALTVDELEAVAGGVPECDIGCAPTTTNQCTGNMQCN